MPALFLFVFLLEKRKKRVYNKFVILRGGKMPERIRIDP